MGMKLDAALIGDIVDSRGHHDRRFLQRQVDDVLTRVNIATPAVEPLTPTVGDEFQAVYDGIESALVATLRIRLSLPPNVDCRFGLGSGAYESVGSSQYGHVQDGPAWWNARDAIVAAKRRENGRNKSLRTWYIADSSAANESMPQEGLINALLLCRDELIGDLNPRQRRLLLGLLDGKTQAALAASEKVSASAVSQSLRACGALALLSAHKVMASQLC